MFTRAIILVFGPVLLIAGCYFMTVGRGQLSAQAATHEHDDSQQRDFDLDALQAGAEDGLTLRDDRAATDARSRLAVACDERARQLHEHLTSSDRIIVRPPYVLAGNVAEEELDRQYRETILPTARALSLAFFDAAPDEPMTLLLYSSEEAYRNAAWHLDRRDSTDYYGYYIRPDRRIVLNLATGDGTLAHELTHALAHFDFPQMPEWFDEGLASVFEEADFSPDGLQLVGVTNWRLNYLLDAMQKRRLKTLESLITARKVDADHQAVQYAQARYFCLYLQERGLLPFFYRKFRQQHASDPSGARTLCSVLGTEDFDSIDRDFRRWVIALYEQLKTPATHAEPQASL
ncbi:hypothetical protein GC176_02605 [bacterium]|nr:hypothetical protein [bacterium]